MLNVDEQKAKANAFRFLHHESKALLLPNVWDVASARIIEDAGFPAIATTSAGIAFSLGYPDGQKISREEMLARVARIVRAVKLPVTADAEAGYGDRPEDAAQTAREAIAAGADGVLRHLDGVQGVADNVLQGLALEADDPEKRAVVVCRE